MIMIDDGGEWSDDGYQVVDEDNVDEEDFYVDVHHLKNASMTLY